MARNIMPTPVSDSPTTKKRQIDTIDIVDSDDDMTKDEEEQLKRLQVSRGLRTYTTKLPFNRMQEKQRRRDQKRVKAEIKAEPETLKILSNGVIDLTD